jgi:hypothetical protein
LGAAANRGADALFIQPIADTDDHPTGVLLRAILNNSFILAIANDCQLLE